MANVITGNPFILDSAADNIVAPGGVAKLRPKLIIYSGATAAGHAAEIEDGNEVLKFKLTATGSGDCVVVPLAGTDFAMDGLSLGAIGSGAVYIYF